MFSVTAVAKARLAAWVALTKILELEKEVSRLRRHVSVLSRRNHELQEEVKGLRKGEEEKDNEVASQKEPELQVAAFVAETPVAEPSKLGVEAEMWRRVRHERRWKKRRKRR